MKALRKAVRDYLALRRGLGFKFEMQGYHLRVPCVHGGEESISDNH